MRRSVEVTDALRSRLASAAATAGLDARALARKARLSHRVVRDVLSGARRRADRSTIEKMCRALKIPPPEPARAGDASVTPAARGPGRRAVAIVLAVILVGVVIALATRRGFTPAIGLASDGRWISVVDSASGNPAWQVEHDSRVKPIAIGRSGNTRSVYYGLETPDEFLLYARAARSGELRWGYRPDAAMFRRVFGSDVIGGADLKVARIRPRDLDGDGREDVVAVIHHVPWYPSAVVFIAHDGRVLSTYYVCGSVDDVVFFDLDGDGRDECLAYGPNNATALRAAMICVLDWRAGDGASIDSLSAPTHFDPGCPLRDTARARVLFPAFGAADMDRLAAVRLTVSRVACEPGDSGPRIIADVGAHGTEYLRVVMDAAFRPLSTEAAPELARRVASWPDGGQFLRERVPAWARGRIVFGAARPGAPDS
jgi:hypothetical protein